MAIASENQNMATTDHSDIDELLTCSVCLEWYKSPRRLPCPHSYCLECLRKIVKKSKNKKQISCPECRFKHTVPENGVVEFPLDVKLAHFIQTTQNATKDLELAGSPSPPTGRKRNDDSSDEEIVVGDSDADNFVEDHTRFMRSITYNITFPPEELQQGLRELETSFFLCVWYLLELIITWWANGSIIFSIAQLVVSLVIFYFVCVTEANHPLTEEPYIIRLCLYIVCVISNIVQFRKLHEISESPIAYSQFMTLRLVFCACYAFGALRCYLIRRKIYKILRWQGMVEAFNELQAMAAAAEARRNHRRPRNRRNRNRRQ